MSKFPFLLLLITLNSSCQDFGKLKIITSLPSSLDEVSGIETIPGSPLLWIIDDSGNEPKVFGYDVNEELIKRELLLEGIQNNDWEDLASDTLGNLYVGDFGNNNNDRKNLAIYTINNIESGPAATSVTYFYLEDQSKFPPKKKNRNFDVEAFIYLNNHFYLFTRNRSSKFDGVTKLYKLPARPGDFQAKLIAQYVTCQDREDCQITSATINHRNGNIALLGYNKVWLIKNYEGDDFFNGTVEKIKLDHQSQKESITFIDDNSLYIADERNKNEGGNLYLLQL